MNTGRCTVIGVREKLATKFKCAMCGVVKPPPQKFCVDCYAYFSYQTVPIPITDLFGSDTVYMGQMIL